MDNGPPEPERRPPLRDLAAREREEEREEARRANDAFRFDPTDSVLMLQTPPLPGHPDWTPRVFYDPDQFPTEASRNAIRMYYARRDADQTNEKERARLGRRVFIPLRSAELHLYPLLPFAAEVVLRQRGFVSDEEYVRSGSGPKSRTAYVARNESAVYHLATLLQGVAKIGASVGTPWARFVTSDFVEQLVGKTGRRPVPLVERYGLLLPCRRLARPYPIHLAHDRLWTEVEIDGLADPSGLCRALPIEIAEQASFELQHAAQVFPGGSAEAVLLWQTQAMASLRKAAWLSRFPSDDGAWRRRFRADAASILRLLRRGWRDGQRDTANVSILPLGEVLRDGGRRVDLDHYRRRIRRRKEARQNGLAPDGPSEDIVIIQEADASLLTDTIDTYRSDLSESDCGVHVAASPVRFGITAAQVLIAALHGATYMPDLNLERSEDRDNPLLVLQPLALWLGTLKRRQTGVIDGHIAGLLHRVSTDAANDVLTLFDTILEPRLGPGLWDVIFRAAMDVHESGGAAPIRLVYRWTHDIERPWMVAEEEDALVITGPLLDFPCDLSAYGAKRVLRVLSVYDRALRRARKRVLRVMSTYERSRRQP